MPYTTMPCCGGVSKEEILYVCKTGNAARMITMTSRLRLEYCHTSKDHPQPYYHWVVRVGSIRRGNMRAAYSLSAAESPRSAVPLILAGT